jgi:hypothetical protein
MASFFGLAEEVVIILSPITYPLSPITYPILPPCGPDAKVVVVVER